MVRKLKFIIVCSFLIFNSEYKSQEKPNILWIVCEDQSLFFSSYGDSIAKTPNIDGLAFMQYRLFAPLVEAV
jgi:N-sulfoglucosamine sulfohydrolase